MALLIILCFLCCIANKIYVYTIWKTLHSVFYLDFTQRPDLFGIGVVEFEEIEDVEIAVEESYYILEYQATGSSLKENLQRTWRKKLRGRFQPQNLLL